MNPLSLFYTVRSYAQSYAGIVGQRFLSLIWVVAAVVIVWFYGASLGMGDFRPLEPVRNRLIFIGVIVAAWLVWVVVAAIRKRRADARMIDAIAADGGANPDAEAKAEVDALRERLREAMATLRKVVGKRFGYVYELPWYVMMGAPGSGKTTSLVNSGLKFPLGAGIGGEPVGGVGGTRHCNWWFAEEAIVIDTAGRYTTHGDFSGVDKAGWNGFLQLIRKHRRSQPINGVLVTISIPDLLHRDPSERLEEIRQVRQRLSEMDDILKARIPVYIVLTKADLLDGFVPFFDGLARSDRDQVWGTTFDLGLSHDPRELPDRFLTEFDLLRERVDTLLLERLQQEPDIDQRGRIFRLPAQMSLLREPVHEVLTELTSQSRFIAAPLVRGVYLASGTQENLPAGAQGAGRTMRRSYFLSRLFHEVIFGEASLVAHDKRLTGRNLMLRRAALALAGGIVAFVLVGWIGAFLQNRAAIAHAETETARFETLAATIPTENVSDADFASVLAALNTLRNANSRFGEPPALGFSFGLDQEEKTQGSHRLAYGRALNTILLPRLLVHLQNELADEEADTRRTVDALKLYAMLGGLGPLVPAEVQDGARRVFDRLYPGEGRRGTREELNAHVASLVERPLARIAIDEALVERTQERIADQSIAARGYDVLKGRGEAAGLVAWTVSGVVGTSGETAFERASEASLREGVPGLFTTTGYRTVVLPQLQAAAETAIGEEWVRGVANPPGTSPSEVSRDILALYFAEFEEQWAAIAGDIRTRTAQDLAGMTEVARVLSAAPFPLVELARSLSEATNLAGGVPAEIASSLPADAGSPPDPFAPLREALARPAEGATPVAEGEEPPSQVAAVQPLLAELFAQLSRAAASSAEVAAIFDVEGQLSEANQALVAQARRLPAPVDGWVGGLAANVDQLAVSTARSQLGAEWAAGGARLCEAAIAGRYPFDRSADTEVALDDFTRVFGPEGAFESFFQNRLAPFVDTSTVPWRWRGTFGAEGTEADALVQFAMARQIREAFFTSGTRPSVGLNVTPVALDQSATAAVLRIGEDRVVYAHGPVISRNLTWPSADGSTQSSVLIQPAGWDNIVSRSGPWSALRLFDASQTTRISDDRFRARFTTQGLSAEFEVQVGSILNPFATDALESFRCPAGF